MGVRHAIVATLIAGVVASSACRSATMMTVEVTADFPCGDLHGVAIALGPGLGGDLDEKGAASTAITCDKGYVGRLVVVPSGDNEDEIGIRVVGGFGRDVEECAGPSPGKGCIVARRTLRYSPHADINIPIVLRAACDGIACGLTETCSKGACVGATIDASKCQDGTCDEDTLGPPSTTPPPTAGNCTGKSGPPMLRIEASKPYCIDATEATNAEYLEFLDSDPLVTLPPECASWNLGGFAPGRDPEHPEVVTWPPAPGHEKYPVVGIDWCDAWAYCNWRGKRLCGRIGGGKQPLDEAADVRTDEWSYACSAGGTRRYPYGGTYSEATCNVAQQVPYSGRDTEPVGSRAACVGGFAGLFDMAGNVEEWTNACADDTNGAPQDDDCITHGASVNDGSADVLEACATSAFLPHDARNTVASDVGVRCCADP